jgi:hypothetical protein
LHLRIASFEWLIWWCNSSIWLAQISPPFSWLSFFPPSYPMLREPIFKCDFETYHRAVEKKSVYNFDTSYWDPPKSWLFNLTEFGFTAVQSRAVQPTQMPQSWV